MSNAPRKKKQSSSRTNGQRDTAAKVISHMQKKGLGRARRNTVLSKARMVDVTAELDGQFADALQPVQTHSAPSRPMVKSSEDSMQNLAEVLGAL